MATVSDAPMTGEHQSSLTLDLNTLPNPNPQPLNSVITTIYSFPRMEPMRFAYYPNNYLYLPLRKDILHRAVIYEGDSHRQGTASTKWRDDVHGSHKKVRQQKGTGMARVGDKQSPTRRGGGVAFGPKPRDFATDLPRKIYDQAFRIALSHRYRKGELIVVDSIKDVKLGANPSPHYLKSMFERNGWGRDHKGSLLVCKEETKSNKRFLSAVSKLEYEARILTMEETDVKNILEMGRIIIEQDALNAMLLIHSRDLVPPVDLVEQARSPQIQM